MLQKPNKNKAKINLFFNGLSKKILAIFSFFTGSVIEPD